jgi:hypothetical protein
MKSSNLFNPFNQIAGFKSLNFGLIGLLIVTYLAFITGTHFNGLLNINFAKDSDYWVFITESITNWLLISAFIYISGLILSKSKIRVIDILGTTLLSRIPLIIAPLIRIIPAFQSFMILSWQMYFVIGFYLISLIWTIILLFNAFKISCNLKNEKLIISFIISILLSEICTKLIIILLT